MSLPSAEKNDQFYSLNNISEVMRTALIKKLTDRNSELSTTEMVELSRIEYALSNPKPYKSSKK